MCVYSSERCKQCLWYELVKQMRSQMNLYRYELVIDSGRKKLTSDEKKELSKAVRDTVVSLNLGQVSFKEI